MGFIIKSRIKDFPIEYVRKTFKEEYDIKYMRLLYHATTKSNAYLYFKKNLTIREDGSLDISSLSFEKLANVVLREVYQYSMPKKFDDSRGIKNYSRNFHGVGHVCRVAIIAEEVRKILQASEEEIMLAKLGSIFHDSCRKSGGRDLWDKNSSLLFYVILRDLGYDDVKSKNVADRIANKDRARYNDNIALMVQAGDCINIMRCYNSFNVSMLKIFEKLSKQENETEQKQFEQLEELIVQHHTLIRKLKPNRNIRIFFQAYKATDETPEKVRRINELIKSTPTITDCKVPNFESEGIFEAVRDFYNELKSKLESRLRSEGNLNIFKQERYIDQSVQNAQSTDFVYIQNAAGVFGLGTQSGMNGPAAIGTFCKGKARFIKDIYCRPFKPIKGESQVFEFNQTGYDSGKYFIINTLGTNYERQAWDKTTYIEKIIQESTFNVFIQEVNKKIQKNPNATFSFFPCIISGNSFAGSFRHEIKRTFVDSWVEILKKNKNNIRNIYFYFPHNVFDEINKALTSLDSARPKVDIGVEKQFQDIPRRTRMALNNLTL